MATGESGSSSGSTTDSACLTTSPLSRIRAVSPPQPSPVPTWALTCGLAAARRRGSRRAPGRGARARPRWAACMASSASSSSTTMISVITMPMAGLPARVRARTNSAAISDDVGVRSSSIMVMASSRCVRRGRASRRRTPGPRCRTRRRSGLPLLRPVLEDRVEDLPGQLDLLVPREQRRVAEQHVEDQPLVGLGARLGERAAVGEVHVDVADLHRGAGHLGAEPHRHALVGLDPDHQRVLGELLGRGGAERQVRRPLEDDRHLGDPAARAACRCAGRTARPPSGGCRRGG